MEQEIVEEEKPRRSRNIIYAIIVIIILILILILFLYMIRSPLFFRSGAYSTSSTKTPETKVVTTPTLSLDNSYVFASPLRAKTGGEQIRITVFILDDRGLGMSGKTVTLGDGGKLQVTSVQPVTDAQGRATFDIASVNAPGIYVIEASVGGAPLTQKVTITFD